MTDRQTDRQTNRQTDRQTDRQTKKEVNHVTILNNYYELRQVVTFDVMFYVLGNVTFCGP